MAFWGMFPKAAVEKERHPTADIERLSTILASIREAIIITDARGKVTVANPASELITAYLPQALIGRKVQEVLTFTCTKADPSWFLREALAGWRAVELPQDCSLLQPRGTSLPVAARATPLYTSDGQYVGIVLVLRDLTDEVRLKHRQYEFLSFVSHQLRHPLGSLLWGLELIQEEKNKLNPPHREILDDLVKVVQQFTGFIGELIDVSRFEEGRVEFKMEPVDVRTIAEDTAKELQGLALSQNVTITLFPDTPRDVSFTITGDRARLRDVFLNLLSNAIRYNHPRGRVTIKAELVAWDAIERLAAKAQKATGIAAYLRDVTATRGRVERFLLISISDTGMGIPANEQANVFESFFRGSNVTRKGLQGSGLGLVIVRTIIERLAGRIFFESKENVGTTFYLVFPIHVT